MTQPLFTTDEAHHICPACGHMEPNTFLLTINHPIPPGETECFKQIITRRHERRQHER